ncbi:unnamed protein product [Spirodela intermedia]|uniref:Uncharacterized protein n=1 Tax=Spirodela intermedia TaxID=51605 RepID=A0A7I8KES8_SPIIN|nr:unnamed protein product [Spirodela intermedia]
MEYPPNFYRLTSLQIGNVRGYPSSSYLYSAPESKKLLILVDHRPSEILSGNHNQRSAIGASKIFQKSCAVFNAAKSRTKHLLAVDDLGKRRRGILVLEVAWKDVCGMKYQNDLLVARRLDCSSAPLYPIPFRRGLCRKILCLQTDASFALEAKFMEQWEFDGPDRASRYVSSWFSGTDSEVRALKDCLRWIISSGRTDSSESVPKEDGDERESSSGTDDRHQQDKDKLLGDENKCGQTFILFRFGDENNNPSADLRKTILDDVRLPRLLESGLPSWAIFFQSYPPFSHCYRPWLRHLVRTIHGLILFISFVIGFYDLYRNIPLMKADLSRISGFLCLWMEACGRIISQNFEKAVMWFLRMGKLLAEPLAVGGFGMFLAPLWRKCAGTAELMSTVLSYAIASLYQLIGVLINWPWEIISSSMGKTGEISVLGSMKTVMNGLVTLLISWNQTSQRDRDIARGLQHRSPTDSSPPPRSCPCRHPQDHCDRCEQEAELPHR